MDQPNLTDRKVRNPLDPPRLTLTQKKRRILYWYSQANKACLASATEDSRDDVLVKLSEMYAYAVVLALLDASKQQSGWIMAATNASTMIEKLKSGMGIREATKRLRLLE
jgi:hypothetical protein